MMTTKFDKFIEAQRSDYELALSEIRNGKKVSHWMWYIFPQINGLGLSPTTKYYAIKDLNEAVEYLADPVLGQRLVQISLNLLSLPGSEATTILGHPDDLKLQSSMTLFSSIPGAHPVFKQVLSKYFGNKEDRKTIDILLNGNDYNQ